MWQGKTALFLGDSITQGHGVSSIDKVFWQLVGGELKMTVKGYGVGGTRIAPQKKEVNEAWNENFIERAKKMDKTADVICVFGGTNDYGHGDAPIGTIEDRTSDTFYGALYTLFSYLCSTYPTAHIFVMTPLHRLNEDSPRGDGYKEPTLPLCGYVKIIREVAEKFSLPVVDLYKNSGIQPAIEEHKTRYMPDGLHPNDLGHEKLARMVVKHLQNV
jgi:lysophospholipase L1-like esterase